MQKKQNQPNSLNQTLVETHGEIATVVKVPAKLQTDVNSTLSTVLTTAGVVLILCASRATCREGAERERE